MRKVFLPGFLLLVLSAAACAATMPEVQMKVMDEQDHTPLPGVHVLFLANAHEGTFTGHGGRTANLFAIETVTDEAGSLHFPKQSFGAHPFFLNTNYHNPSMALLKPGYALLILTNNLRIIPNLDEVTSWQYDKQTVAMKRAATDAALLEAARSSATHAESALGDPGACAWKKMPRFLLAADRLAAEWNKKRETVADPQLRYWFVTSALQKVLMMDQLFVKFGCGSSKAFFEPYLR